MLPARTYELIRRHLDGVATPGETGELDRLVREQPAAADALAEAGRTDAWLAAHFQVEERTARERSGLRALEAGRARRFRWRVPAAVAAGLLLLAGGAVLLNSFIGQQPAPPDERGPVAKGDPPAPEERAPAAPLLLDGELTGGVASGEALRVAGERSARIRLTDGSLATLEPAARAVLHGPVADVRQVVELVEGAGTFRVENGDGQFQVDTPWGRVTALGTEFRVKVLPVNKRGERLAVAVLEGVVQVDFAGRTYVLADGEDRVFQSGNEATRAVRETRGTFAGAADGHITLSYGPERPRTLTLPLLARAPVTIDGRPGSIEELTRGAPVVVQRLEGDDAVLAVRAEGPTVVGELGAVDGPAGTVTVVRKPQQEGRRKTTYRLAPEARVTVDGGAASLEDLDVGAPVVLRLSVDQKSAVSVAQGKAPRKKG